MIVQVCLPNQKYTTSLKHYANKDLWRLNRGEPERERRQKTITDGNLDSKKQKKDCIEVKRSSKDARKRRKINGEDHFELKGGKKWLYSDVHS